MIKLENYEVMGWEHAVRGMRNPMNSWAKSDSGNICLNSDNYDECPYIECEYRDMTFKIGSNDYALMMKLANAGPVHGKFRRMITVYVDITAPLYWWKEFDTYKVGTVANSCSTMHKIHEKEFTLEDFSHEHIITGDRYFRALMDMIETLNYARNLYLTSKDKSYWWQMIQLLPSSYNQKRTVMLNYEVLANIYQYRKNHKLDEWREFCKWIEELPYSEIIVGDVNANERG